MKVLVTGASGFVGRVLCADLLRKGDRVIGSIRNAPDKRLNAVDYVEIGEINAATDWSAALNGIEVVIHLAARVHVMQETATDPLTEFRKVNADGTEHLARSAAASGVKRLVYVSSIKVNGEATEGGQKYTEVDTPSPHDPYGVSKCEAEQVLRRVAQETGLEVVIVRPPLVYGPGVKGNFAQMLKALGKGIPLPLASINNRRSLIYVGNLANALIVCATHPAAAGQTYLLSDGEDISTPDLLRALAAAMGVHVRLIPFSPVLLQKMAQVLGRGAQADRLLGSLQIDSGKIRRELNWTPPYSLQQGLEATAEWYRIEHT